jgi:hypothetical protein
MLRTILTWQVLKKKRGITLNIKDAYLLTECMVLLRMSGKNEAV